MVDLVVVGAALDARLEGVLLVRVAVAVIVAIAGDVVGAVRVRRVGGAADQTLGDERIVLRRLDGALDRAQAHPGVDAVLAVAASLLAARSGPKTWILKALVH